MVDTAQLNELPILSRTNAATAYLREIPGSAPDVTSNFNGQRVTDVVNQLDGVTMMDAGNNGVNYSYSVEAVGEVKVTTNAFTAEYGRAGGYQVSSVLKSGTSSLHGTGFWFHQNEGLNANSYTNNMQKIQKGLSRSMLSGFTVGGAIWMPVGPLKKLGRQRLFWFTSFEFNPTKTNTVVQLEVPTAAEVQGNFAGVTDNSGKPVIVINPATHAQFTGNVVPASQINPTGQALLNLILTQDPVNVSGQPQFNSRTTLPILPVQKIDDIYKIDYNITTKHRISGHLLRYHNNNPSYGGLNTSYGNVSSNVDWSLYPHPDGEKSIAVNFVSVLSPTMTNEINYGRSFNFLPTSAPTSNSPYLKANTPGWGAAPQLIQGADPANLIPGFNFSGSNVTTANAPQFNTGTLPYVNRNPISDYVDNLTKVSGNHTLKAGVFIETGTKGRR
jgi:hypothetical protein